MNCASLLMRVCWGRRLLWRLEEVSAHGASWYRVSLTFGRDGCSDGNMFSRSCDLLLFLQGTLRIRICIREPPHANLGTQATSLRAEMDRSPRCYGWPNKPPTKAFYTIRRLWTDVNRHSPCGEHLHYSSQLQDAQSSIHLENCTLNP
jgi:hypothetical protein